MSYQVEWRNKLYQHGVSYYSLIFIDDAGVLRDVRIEKELPGEPTLSELDAYAASDLALVLAGRFVTDPDSQEVISG